MAYYPLVRSGDTRLWLDDGPHERITGAVTLGYLFWDTVCACVHTYARVPTREPLMNAGMVVHHIVSALTIGGALAASYGVPLQAMFIISEMSTPFLNIHLTMRRDDPRRTVNGLAMWSTFFVGRILLLSLLGLALIATCVPAVTDRHPVLYWALIITVLPLFGLNWWWFYRITSGLLKAIAGREPSPQHGRATPRGGGASRAADGMDGGAGAGIGDDKGESGSGGDERGSGSGGGGGGGGGVVGRADRLDTKHLDSPTTTAAPRSPSSMSARGAAATKRM
jgi:hypothetical protein